MVDLKARIRCDDPLSHWRFAARNPEKDKPRGSYTAADSVAKIAEVPPDAGVDCWLARYERQGAGCQHYPRAATRLLPAQPGADQAPFRFRRVRCDGRATSPDDPIGPGIPVSLLRYTAPGHPSCRAAFLVRC